MGIELDPTSGAGFIKEQFPHLTIHEAHKAYWNMRTNDGKVRKNPMILNGISDINEDPAMRAAYDRWKTWKALQL